VPVKAFIIAAAAANLRGQSWFDIGHLRGRHEVLRIKNILPLYQTVTIKRFAARVLKMNVSNTPKVKFHDRSASLDIRKHRYDWSRRRASECAHRRARRRARRHARTGRDAESFVGANNISSSTTITVPATPPGTASSA